MQERWRGRKESLLKRDLRRAEARSLHGKEAFSQSVVNGNDADDDDDDDVSGRAPSLPEGVVRVMESS